MLDSTPGNVYIIKSKLFSLYPALRFGISTKQGGVGIAPFDFNLSYNVCDEEKSVLQNRRIFYRALNIPEDRVIKPKQVHGDAVLEVSSAGGSVECDGLVTNVPDLYLAITIADCVPVFLFDPVHQCVAAVHAGWRGTHLNIVRNAVINMADSFRSTPADIKCYIGPCADVCCYEVGQDVAELFHAQYVVHRQEKKFINFKKMIKDSLSVMGVPESSIEISASCTICGSSLFHSYRREGKNSGRMMGMIGLRGTE